MTITLEADSGSNDHGGRWIIGAASMEGANERDEGEGMSNLVESREGLEILVDEADMVVKGADLLVEKGNLVLAKGENMMMEGAVG